MADSELLPVAEYVGRDPQGAPRLQGCACAACDAVFLGSRKICARCGARDKMHEKALSNRGKLYNYTVVHRSLPGVEVPFVSVIVDLEGGGNVKGNLVGVAEADIRYDMPVKVVFERAKNTDAKGRAYLSFHFEPA